MSNLREIYRRALHAFASKEYDEAIALYSEMIEADSGFTLAYQGLAEVYAHTDRLNDAITTIQKAIKLEPDESLFHTSLSRFYQAQGKIPEAEEAAAMASKLQGTGA